jgi:hypothetical protein
MTSQSISQRSREIMSATRSDLIEFITALVNCSSRSNSKFTYLTHGLRSVYGPIFILSNHRGRMGQRRRTGSPYALGGLCSSNGTDARRSKQKARQ